MEMKRKVIWLTILTAIFFGQTAQSSSNFQAQEKPQQRSPQAKTATKSSDTDLQEQTRQQLLMRVGDVLRITVDGAKQWKDAVAAASALAQVADLLWDFDPEMARDYLIQAWITTNRIEESKQERSQYRNQPAPNNARSEVMLIARKRAPELAKKWLAQMAQETEAEQNEVSRGVFDDRTTRSAVLLQMAMYIATENPNGAADLAMESLRDGISFGFQQVLIKIQEKDVELAQTVFRAALARLRTGGMLDPNELLTLYAYLYTPGRIFAANTADDRGSRQLAVSANQPRIIAAAQLNPALAREFLSLAADLLLNAPLPTTTGNSQLTARSQLSVIGSLIGKISQHLPERATALQIRAQQIDADARFSTVPPPPRADLPAPLEGESNKEYADRRVDLLEEAAKNETDSLSRDIAYAKAALATTVEHYERGLSLAGKVQDESLRIGVLNWLLYRAALHFIKSGGLNKAYELSAKNTDSLQRAATLVIGAQQFLKDKDLIRARQWLEEARTLVRKVESDGNRSRVAFGIVSTYGQFDKLMALQSLSETISSLDQTSIVSNDERAPLIKRFSGLSTLADFTYGTNGFGLKAAVKVFAPDQFENVLYSINNIPSPEARGMAVIALCQEYLQVKLKRPDKVSNSPTEKSSRNPVSPQP